MTAHPTVQRTSWETLSEVELATAEWVDWFNHRRVHGEIGYVPPTEYEATQGQQNKRPRIAVAAWGLDQTRNGSGGVLGAVVQRRWGV
ncbi:hypothetical protein GCM10010207_69420 [Streptomyces atratus]|nr:hypothetical protein GCM10010207_69420 [Streptomyces atratus]